MAIHLLAEIVQHLVDGDELRTLEVPMGLLGQQSQVDVSATRALSSLIATFFALLGRSFLVRWSRPSP